MDRRPPSRADILASWDRLSFRLCFFGALGIIWVIQGRVGGARWSDVIRGEIGGIMPWAFLAPIVLAIWRRYPISQDGLLRGLAAHLVGMFIVFVPYWAITRVVVTVWQLVAYQGDLGALVNLKPTSRNLFATFQMVPFTYLFVLLGAAALDQSKARREEEAQAARLAGQLAEARLGLLQRQLHPHFLFNALQAISTLLHRDPRTADRLLVRLSTLLRAMLDEASSQTLSLRTELDLTRKYVEIEQARFADRLRIEWTVDETLLERQVPSLVVLPLVENAIRHGLSPKVGPGTLRIGAAHAEGQLQLTVADDGLGATEPLKLGIGIGNTQERLRSLYGDRAGLTIHTRPGEGFLARIHLPLSEDAPAKGEGLASPAAVPVLPDPCRTEGQP